ncbi:MAG: phosphatase domain-containing protein [Myxococcota bacterium]
MAEAERLIYRWDLDKTYLRTEFDTVRDLIRTAFEPASQKRAFPGAGALLREIRGTDPAGIFILSGSPEQMRRVLEAKLRLDGIRWDSFTLKPSLKNALRGRFRFLRDQVGYKLASLLQSRADLDASTEEVLFGDDAEADAFIYSLYADICAGRVGPETLIAVLERARVYSEDIPALVRMDDRVPRHPTVEHIFIHLERVSPVSGFSEFGRRVCPFYNYFQPALVLVQSEVLAGTAALRVGAEIVGAHAFSPDTLIASTMDLARRGYVDRRAAERILEGVATTHGQRVIGVAPLLGDYAQQLEKRLGDFEPIAPLEVAPIDYVGLFSRDKARARAARHRARSRR